MAKSRFKAGDHLKVMRTGYSHHGIYVGRGLVIHYSGEVKRKKNASIKRVRLGTFAAGRSPKVVEYEPGDCLPVREVVRRAEYRIGEQDYSLVVNNCERFAIWCKTGRETYGEQVERGAAVIEVAAPSLTLPGTLAAGTALLAGPLAPWLAGKVLDAFSVDKGTAAERLLGRPKKQPDPRSGRRCPRCRTLYPRRMDWCPKCEVGL